MLRIVQYQYELWSGSTSKDQGHGTVYVDTLKNLNQEDIVQLVKTEIRSRLQHINFDTIDKFIINITNNKNTKLYKIENNWNHNIIWNRIFIGTTYSLFLLGGLVLGRTLFRNNDSV